MLQYCKPDVDAESDVRMQVPTLAAVPGLVSASPEPCVKVVRSFEEIHMIRKAPRQVGLVTRGWGGGTPYTEVYMYVPRKCPCFWPFFSLCPKKKCKFSIFVPQLNLIFLSLTEEEISQ